MAEAHVRVEGVRAVAADAPPEGLLAGAAAGRLSGPNALHVPTLGCELMCRAGSACSGPEGGGSGGCDVTSRPPHEKEET